MTKKILSMALAIAMVMALSVTAFAQTVGTAVDGTGSITIPNASKGETYKVVKLFTATVNAEGTAISYKGEIPDELKDYFVADSQGNITVAEGKSDKEVTNAVDAWAAKQTTFAAQATSDGSQLVFEGLEYGYYAVVSSQGAVVSVDSLKPNATVYDKNSSTRSIVKTVDDEEVQIGDTATYTVVFTTSNFIGEGEKAVQVEEYVLHDTLPSFLSNVVITSVKVDNDPAVETDAIVDLSANYTKFDADNKITLDWYDEAKKANIYENGAVVTVVYTATVTADVITNGTNTATLTWTGEQEGLTDTAVIKTYAVDIVKIDGNTREELTGAEFELYGADGAKIPVVKTEDGVYRVAMTGENEIVKIEAGKATVQGLDSDDTYYLAETKAPNGYNVLTENVEFKCVANTVLGDVPSNIAIEVENFAGTELPSTGGIGTTIFYALGAVMVIGAGVLLVAKKRMSVEG